MELEIRQYFIVSELRNTDEDTCARITDTLLSNNDLCAQWILATSTTTDDEHAFSILKMVVDLYITIRGFAFTKSCLELYKKATKKHVAKSKGIRKELFISHSTL